MNPKIKNIILFTAIALVMIFIYIFFIKKDKEQANLVTTSDSASTINTNTLPIGGIDTQADSQIAKDFLAVLLSVKNITLDDSIFNDIAFTSLKDSSILLIPDGNEGRINPFAPIGTEVNSYNITNISNSNTPVGTDPENIPVSPLPVN